MSWRDQVPGVRFATQAMLVQVALLLLMVGAAFGLLAMKVRAELENQYEQRALGVAQAVAADPVIIADLDAHNPAPEVQQRAEAVRARTRMLFVVVADDHGIRYSHPDPARIGELVSTPPEALSGRDVVSFETGTLGPRAGGKAPVRAPDGRVVGQVSVGVAADEVSGRFNVLVGTAAGFTGIATVLGIVAAVLFARRLRRQTLGLEPADLRDLLREHEAVLHGIGEGVLAVDPAGRITICNDAAATLIGCRPVSGCPVSEADLPPGLQRLIADRRAVRGALVVAGDRALVVTAAPVRRDGRDLGQVLTMRDRTDFDELVNELDVVRALSDAVRAQAHEYTNRLHTLSGLLSLGHRDEALAYLRELADDPLATEYGDGGRLRDPYMRGLLAAKTAVASERAVDLRLSDASFLPGRLAAPLDVVTVLGNLVDNAIEAARTGRRQPGWVEVSILAEADDLHLVVVDSGDGVSAEAVDRLFEQGYTTTGDDGRPHGIGLALARQSARRHGGDLELTRASGTDCGAVFVARMSGVVKARESDVQPVTAGLRDTS
jgi:two-component system, CitB family, sensor kinase